MFQELFDAWFSKLFVLTLAEILQLSEVLFPAILLPINKLLAFVHKIVDHRS